MYINYWRSLTKVSLLSAFLINVLRVILTIMHPNSDNPAPTGLRRAARAALILVPLFGLQHILIPLRPEVHEPHEHLYQYITVFVVSLQVSFAFFTKSIRHYCNLLF